MATCPECGVSSRVDSTAFSIEKVLVFKPLGTWSVAGQQMKTVAYERLEMSCQCGWRIRGYIDGEDFVADE
jgi:hypothetical protein